MTKHTSIIEDFELASGATITVQARQGMGGAIVLSIDSADAQHTFYMKLTEAEQLAATLTQVVQEATS